MTEEITGIDLVQSQVRVAGGASLADLGETVTSLDLTLNEIHGKWATDVAPVLKKLPNLSSLSLALNRLHGDLTCVDGGDDADSNGKLAVVAVTANALTAADYVLIPVQTDPMPLVALHHLMGTVGALQRRANYDLKVLGILPTMYSARNTQDRESLEELKRDYGKSFPVFPPIPRSTVYPQSSGSGRPTLSSDGVVPGREVYAEIVNHLLTINGLAFDSANGAAR